MLNLSAKNIRLNGSAANKEEAIKLVASGLVANGNVEKKSDLGNDYHFLCLHVSNKLRLS